MFMSELIKNLNEVHAKSWEDKDIIKVTITKSGVGYITRDNIEESFSNAGGVSGAYDLVNGLWDDIEFTDGYCPACDAETPSLAGYKECLVCGQAHA